jgi:hypothetical protein
MSSLVVAALVVASVWLLILTVGLLLCIRQLGALMVRTELIARGAGGAQAHGAAVGFELSEDLLRSAPMLREGRRVVLLLSATCATCEQLIEEFAAVGPPVTLSLPEELVVLLVQDDGGERGNEAVQAMTPYATVLRGPEATQIARGLRLANLPSAIYVQDRRIAGSLVFVDRLSQIDELLSGAPSQSRNGEPAAAPQTA